MVGIIDYNAGNIKSVERALDFIGAEYVLSKNPADLSGVDRVIFPGDGEAAYAMRELRSAGYDKFLRECADKGVPILGICIGAQIIFDFSEEGDTECLALVPGTIRHFSSLLDLKSLKVPHMGWNDVSYQNGTCPILEGVPENSDFYFVHSYVIQPKDAGVVKGYAEYGLQVPSVIQSKNIFACQFHPEKSGEAGLRILRNFTQMKRESLC